MAKKYLYFIRHGQQEKLPDFEKMLREGVPYDKVNQYTLGLTSKGVKQAELTGKLLRSLPISSIYCSPLPRAIETAKILKKEFPDLPLQPSTSLLECVPGRTASLTDELSIIQEDDVDLGKERASASFHQFFGIPTGEKDIHEIFVSHGNLIGYLTCRALGASSNLWGNLRIDYCGVTKILIEETGRIILLSHNERGHLTENTDLP